MTTMQRAADESGMRFVLQNGDEAPEVDRIAEVLIRTRRKIGMKRDDRRAISCEVQGDGVLALEPSGALPWAVTIHDDPCHQRLTQPQNEGAAVLENVAAVGCESMFARHLNGGTNGKI